MFRTGSYRKIRHCLLHDSAYDEFHKSTTDSNPVINSSMPLPRGDIAN